MRRRTAAITAVTAVALALSAPAPAGSVAAYSSSTSQIAPGVTLTKISTTTPNQIRVLKIDPSAAATMDVALASRTYPGWARTSSMATAHGALAAVNGDFGLDPGRPAHLFAEDGELRQTSVIGGDGKNFAISADEQHLYADVPGVSLTATQVASNKRWSVAYWNDGNPRAGAISGYTPVGGSVEPTPRNACSARLLPTGGPIWGANQIGVDRTYTVDLVACQSSAMALNGGIVLAANTGTNGATTIRGLVRGETVRFEWSLGWTGVLDSIGGSPLLIDNGVIAVTNCDSYICQVHPRTAVGVTADRKIILMTVDGRQSGWSKGMNLLQEAKFMQSQGAVYAINLDGGGSTTMWVKGRGLVNRPSDGSERSVSSALLVLPGADTGEPKPAAPATQAPSSTDAASSAHAAMLDPASTGGLLDAMANGDVGGRGTLDPSLMDIVRAFRRTSSADGS